MLCGISHGDRSIPPLGPSPRSSNSLSKHVINTRIGVDARYDPIWNNKVLLIFQWQVPSQSSWSAMDKLTCWKQRSTVPGSDLSASSPMNYGKWTSKGVWI